MVEFEKQLDSITVGLDRFAAVIAPANRGDVLPPGFEVERASFAALLAEHFIAKELLYERLRAGGGHELEPTVRRSRTAMLSLVVSYRRHRAAWRPEAVAADPAGYAAAACHLLDHARTLVARDRRTLLPASRRVTGEGAHRRSPTPA